MEGIKMEGLRFEDELKGVNFGDKRLNAVCFDLLEAFANRPNVSIPGAMLSRTELTRAYRFFDNEKVTPAEILRPHCEKTAERCRDFDVVLCPQDTTELDFTRPKQQVAGAGPLADGVRRGVLLHLVKAFTADGTPLGVISAETLTRKDPAPDAPKLSKNEKRKKRLATPVEEKESIRWIEGFRETQKLASADPETTYVSLCDSEADMIDLLAEPRTANLHYIVRACQDRAALGENSRSLGIIRDTLEKQSVLFTNEIGVRGREPKVTCETRSRRTARVSRHATVEIRAGAVTLRAPARCRENKRLSVNVVMVREVDPPEGETPVEWILLTTLPISTVEEVRLIIQYYTVRWRIEVYFRTLKTGCRVEDRRFETLERMLACTAIYLIVAWRTMLLCRLGRERPDLDCDALFEPSEWKSVWAVTHRGDPVPSIPPKLPDMLRLVASLGGYVNRPNRPDPPGEETVWRGLQRMHDLAWAWDTFGPGATPGKDV
jgi:hypothetical protein